MKKILFIIGSLRKESFNKKLAKEVEQMLSERAMVEYLGRGRDAQDRGN